MEDNANLQAQLRDFEANTKNLLGNLSGIVEKAKAEATTPEEKAAIDKASKDMGKVEIEIPKTFDGIGKMLSELQDKMK